jgi:hypothetical protein
MASIVYVLQLQQGKYYVGRTSDLATRFLKHKFGEGAQWTKLYGPLAIVDVVADAPFVETAYTLMYMQRFGIENVRGGPWCNTSAFSSSQLKCIEDILESEVFARGVHPFGHSPQEAPSSMDLEQQTDQLCREKYQRHGCVWEPKEVLELFDCMVRAVPLSNIALLLRRKESAIRSYVTKKVKEMSQRGMTVHDISKETNLTIVDIENALHNKTVDMISYANGTEMRSVQRSNSLSIN